MRLRAWWLLCLCLWLIGCGTRGSGKLKTETRSVSGFTHIDIDGVFKLEAAVTGKEAVEVSGDDNIVPLVDTQVDGHVLIIKMKGNSIASLPLLLKVKAKQLEGVAVRGASTAEIDDVSADPMFSLDVRGASTATLRRGEADHLVLKAQGSSTIDAAGMKAEKVSVVAEGASTVDAGDPKELDVKIKGASSVTHGGSPKITKDVSDSGSVKKR